MVQFLGGLVAVLLAILASWGPQCEGVAALSILSPIFCVVAALLFAMRWRGGGWIQRGIAAGGLTVTALATIPVAQSLTYRATVLAPGTPSVQIVEFNVWTANRAPVIAAAWILRQKPDFVVLLEASEHGSLIADRLAATFPYRTTCRGQTHCSTVILSRTPPLAAAGLAHGDADNRRALSAAYATFATRCGVIALVGLHLSRPFPPTGQARETNALAAALRTSDRTALVITGDMNAPSWGSAVRWIGRALDLRPVGGEAVSWPAPASGLGMPAFIAIDHTLIGSAWAGARAERGPALGSDHYPFVITLQRNACHGVG